MFDEILLVVLGFVMGFLISMQIFNESDIQEKECVDYYLKNDYVLSYCEKYIKK